MKKENDFPNNSNTTNYINFSLSLADWKNFSLQCPFRVQDQQGKANCTYHEGTMGECKPINCPFLDEDMKAELESGEELLKCVIRMEVVV